MNDKAGEPVLQNHWRQAGHDLLQEQSERGPALMPEKGGAEHARGGNHTLRGGKIAITVINATRSWGNEKI